MSKHTRTDQTPEQADPSNPGETSPENARGDGAAEAPFDPWDFAKTLLHTGGDQLLDRARAGLAKLRAHPLQQAGGRLQLLGRALSDLGELARDPEATRDALGTATVVFALAAPAPAAIRAVTEALRAEEEKRAAASGVSA